MRMIGKMKKKRKWQKKKEREKKTREKPLSLACHKHQSLSTSLTVGSLTQ